MRQYSGMGKIKGSIGTARTANSLIGRWTAKVFTEQKDARGEGILIERDTIVLENVKIGRGASATTYPCQFRVTALYDKWYNKYVMSKEPFKRWKNERQHNYKLDVRMLEKDILGQLSDVSLVGNSIYRSTNIYKTIED